MKLLLVDGSNIVMRCAFGGDVPPKASVATATNMIERVARSHNCTHLIATLDTPDAPSWRKELFPAYKAHRTRDTSPWIHEANRAWNQRGWWVEAVAGFEADDVIATIARRAIAHGRPDQTDRQDSGPTREVIVLSGDSDVLPLVEHGLFVLKPINGGRFEVMSRAIINAKYSIVRPGQLMDLKALTGEAGDNVPGVEGIGPVRAQKLLAQHDHVEAVIAAGEGNTCKYSAKVYHARDQVRQSLKLVTLREDVPIVPIQPSGCAIPQEMLL